MKKNKNNYKSLSIIVLSVCMVAFWQVLVSYFWGSKLIAIDRLINEWVIGIRQPFWDNLMIFVTVAGNRWTIFGASILVGGLLLMSGRKKCFWSLVMTNIIGLIFVGFIKYIIGRSRPPLENAIIRVDGFSLPSGHSYFGMVFYGLLTYFGMKHFGNWKKKMAIFLTGFGFIVMLGISRIYLGVHWASDVIAGLSISLIWLTGLVAYLEKEEIYFLEKAEKIEVDLKKGFCMFGFVWFLILIWQFIIVR